MNLGGDILCRKIRDLEQVQKKESKLSKIVLAMLVLMLALLVVFAIATPVVAGSLLAAPSSILGIMTAAASLALLSLPALLFILRTGKRRLNRLLRIHILLAKLAGHIHSFFVRSSSLDPMYNGSTSRSFSNFVGRAFSINGFGFI